MNVARLLRAVGVATATAAVVAVVAGYVLGIGDFLFHNFVLQTATFGAALGAVVATSARTRSGNRAVRLLGFLSAVMIIEVIGYVVVGVAVRHDLGREAYAALIGGELAPRDLPLLLAVVMWFPLWTWIVSLGGFLTFGLLLFPDGQLPSRRWRPVAAASGLAIGLISIGYMILGRPGSDVAITGMEAEGPGGALVSAGFPLFGSCVVACLVSLVVRHRTATAEVRHQIRWVGFTVGAMAVVFVVLVIPQVLGVWGARPVNLGSMVMAPVVVAGYGVAIVKYRLYDIDLVINRAIVVTALGAFITTVYVGIVVGVGQLVGGGDEPHLALSLAATTVVAVAFQPLRRQVQHWANVIVYGRRATPYEVLSRFSHTSATSDHDGLLADAAGLLAGACGASVTIWVRQHEELVPVASSPDGADAARPLPLTDGPADDPRADLTIPVHGEDRQLGAISLAKPANEPPTEEDRQLATQLAAAMGLLLRNRNLTADLAATVDELARARDRLLAAGDHARRMIDRDLRSEPLDLLDRLESEIGDLAERAEAAGAQRTAAILAQTAVDARHAAATVRELASGAYPPRLESDGLATALEARSALAPFPVSVHAAGVGRHPLTIETAVYFSVLEALQNATKYADPTSVQIRIEERGGALSFVVSDDGAGFDPATATRGAGLTNLADRLDALGGEFAVESSPGQGTVVRGWVPLAEGSATAVVSAGSPAPMPTAG